MDDRLRGMRKLDSPEGHGGAVYKERAGLSGRVPIEGWTDSERESAKSKSNVEVSRVPYEPRAYGSVLNAVMGASMSRSD